MGRILKNGLPGKSAKIRCGLQRARRGQGSISRPKDRKICESSEPGYKRRKEKRANRFQAAREKREENREKIAETIAVIDFETDPFAHGEVPEPFCCGFATRNRYESFWHADPMGVIKWAREKTAKFPGYVFAHNGGKFDFPEYLLRDAAANIRGNKALLINGRLVKLAFGKAEIRDSFAILPSPLSAFDKGEIDYNKLHKSRRDQHREEILKYLKRDCQSLHSLVLEFVIQNGIKSPTAASAALNSMRELCQEVDTLSESQDRHFRRWYFGGRVEVFKPGIHAGKFTDYDIKSAYPHAMCYNHSICNKFHFISSPTSVRETDFVLFDGMVNGAFPVRTKKGLSFPHGHGEYFITGWEYLAAKRLGLLGKGKVRFVERPTRLGNFSRYVEYHLAAKEKAEKEGNKAMRLISKILVNSGYGKLAQDPEKWRDYMFMMPDDVIPEDNPEGWEEEICNEKCNYAIWSRPAETPGAYHNVSTAASITGFVRARIMETAHGATAYYCDTDSLTLNSSDKIETGDKLGDFVKEEEYDLLMLAGKKMYAKRLTRKSCPDRKTFNERFGNARTTYFWYRRAAWKVASKGVRFSPSDIFKLCQGKTVTYRNDAPSMSVKSFTRFTVRNIRATSLLPKLAK